MFLTQRSNNKSDDYCYTQSGDIGGNGTDSSNTETNNGNVILDETVPQGSPELPKTGGIPIELLMSAGAMLTTGGLTLKRFKKKNEDK